MFQPEDGFVLHAGDRAFIVERLAEPFDGPSVVVAHHAPHPASLPPWRRRDPLAPAFASDLTNVIAWCRPALWVHGHVGASVDHRVGDTRVLCNPRIREACREDPPPENPGFDPKLVVDLPAADPLRDGSPWRGGPFPQVYRLEHWTVVRVVTTGDLHVLGYRVEGGRGRASSPMRSFDAATRTATTSTGNRYVLVGPPSPDVRRGAGRRAGGHHRGDGMPSSNGWP